MRISIHLESIPFHETLRYLMWHGETVDESLRVQILNAHKMILDIIEPCAVYDCFQLEERSRFGGTTFSAQGRAAGELLCGCRQALLFAATLGAQSERLLLRMQATSHAQALLIDAALSAAIEKVCDQACARIQAQLFAQNLYLTERFSPGYADMPIAQNKDIINVLDAQRQIGLSITPSGLMLPRKSVCAVIGVKGEPTERIKDRCARCAMKNTCSMKKNGACHSAEKE